MAFDKEKDFRYGEEADDGDKEIDPIHEVHIAIGQPRHAGVVVDPDHCNRQANTRGQCRLSLIVRGHAAKRAKGQ